MWEIIEANKRKSISLFVMMGTLLLAIGYILGYYYNGHNGGMFGVFIGLIIWTFLSIISYFSGSKILLKISGAKEISRDVHPQLYNVVEEIKIAANMPKMPKIYIISDPAPNAFATGVKPDNSAIAVTAGLLGKLNRNELQGVVAHEMAHILNRDVLLMTFAGVMLGSITLVSEVFLRSLWYGGGSSRYRSKSSSKIGGQAQIIIMVVAIVFAILGPIMAQLLYFAISRKREYLADASAVRLTRYPEGLASALEKIADSSYELKNANTVTAPMFIANPLKKKGMKLSNLTSTHPPISERVRILRAMQTGVQYLSYESAYQFIRNKREKILPNSASTDSFNIPIIKPTKEWYKAEDPKIAKRNVGDIIMGLNDYSFIDCSCGMRIKIPSDFNRSNVTCPKCKTKHSVPTLK